MSTSLKTCFKCKAEKPRTEFYKHSAMADGLLGKCKVCAKLDVQSNYAANRDYYLQYEQRRKRLPHRIEARREYARTYTYPTGRKRHAAVNAVNNALRKGEIQKQPCCVCGSTTRIHGHHEDYSRPLDVVWLCPLHHAEYHVVKRNIQKALGKP